MKRAHAVLSLVLLAVAAILSCHSSAPAGESSASEARAAGESIELAWRDHIAAAKAKYVEGVLAIYADDVVYAFGDEPDLHGRLEVELSERAALAGADLISAEHTTLELRVFGDFAFEIGTVVGPVRPHGGEEHVVTYRFTAYWQRGIDGTWRIRRLAGRA